MRLGGVLENDQSMTFRQLHQGRHIDHLSVEVNRNDRTRFGGDGPLYSRDAHEIAFGFQVHENRLVSDIRNRFGGCNESVARNDNFLTAITPTEQTPECYLQCVRPIAAVRDVPAAAKLGEFVREGLYDRSADESATVDLFLDRRIELRFVATVLRF